MKLTWKRVAVAGLLAAVLAGGAWAAAPLFIQTRADIEVPNEFAILVKQGTWQGADDFHFARGVAKILADGQGSFLLRVEGFEVRNGPDIEFFLSADATYGPGDIPLGDVPATTGNYNVPISAGVDIDAVRYAIVWCVPFGVLFGTAELV